MTRRWIILAACIVALGGGARAQGVDLELVLAVDASGSIDRHEYVLQRHGYARALTNPDVLAAITRGPHRAIALTFFEWSGPESNVQVIPWTRIGDAASADAVAGRIVSAPRTVFGTGTALGAAIDHGMKMLAQSPFRGVRRVIDISGDGPNNQGRWPSEARDEAVAQGVTINGLVIEDVKLGLDDHFRDEVIGGPSAFVLTAKGFDDFARAVVKKLLQELELAAVPRAFSDHSGSYPELTKKFAHSVGVNSSMISAMAAQRSSTVRAAAFLSNALSFEKACSMGLKSGE